MKKILLLFFVPLFFLSCSKDDTSSMEMMEEEDNNSNTDNTLANPNPPNGNDIIALEEVFGNERTYTSISQVVSSNDGKFFFRGLLNGDYIVGKMNTEGVIIWKFIPNGIPRSIAIDNKGNLLVVSNEDNNNDGASEKSHIFLFDKNGGSPLSQITWNDYENIRLNGIDKNKAVGRCQVEGIIYPVSLNFSVNENNILIKEDIDYYSTIPSHTFISIKEGYVLASKVVGTFDDVESTQTYVGKIGGNFNLDWYKEIFFSGTTFSDPKKMIIDGDDIVIVGRVGVEEQDNPNGGGYWSAGMIASIKKNGEINYSEVINPSNKSDVFNAVVQDNNFYYALGGHSGILYSQEEKVFRNGWICKIEKSTGKLIENKFMGDENFSSIFFTGTKFNNEYFGYGFTEEYYIDNRYFYKGWLVKFNTF